MSTIELVSAWLLSLIVSAAPPGKKIYYPEAQETQEETLARYQSITQDVVEVVYAPGAITLFQGPTGRSRTATVILSVMSHESNFLKHIDYGIGKYARGDGGRSWCLMQLNVGTGRTMRWDMIKNRPAPKNGPPSDDIFEGYTGEELVSNRKACIQEGLKVLAVSFGGTRGLPLEDRLRIYASGDREKGHEASKNRMGQAIRWFNSYPYQSLKDADVTQELLNRTLQVPSEELISLLDTNEKVEFL